MEGVLIGPKEIKLRRSRKRVKKRGSPNWSPVREAIGRA